MPVSSTHPQYTKFLAQWTRCRDVIEGSDAVKAKGTEYLPKLTDQSLNEYNAYKKRALFFSAAGRSLQGLIGTMTRRRPTIQQEGMDEYFNDVSLSHKSFQELFSEGAEEVLSTGRYGMLADVGVDGGRAYISVYPAEHIINWRIDAEGKLLMLVLMEIIEVPNEKDPFEMEEQTQYRHLYINADGVYVQELYNEKDEIISTAIPTVRGDTMSDIPFVCVTPTGLSLAPQKPPILDIVDVNLSQYMTSADLENGRHFVALPTPVVTGAESDGALKVGGTKAWIISNHQAKAYYLEFEGQGLQSLEKAIAEKTSQMAQFSSKLMDTTTRGSEAVEAVRLRHSADSATLYSVALALESAFNTVFEWIAAFDNHETPSIELNKEFLQGKLTSTELRELTNALVSGAIDEETFFYNLERGEMLPLGKDQIEHNLPDNSDENVDNSSNSDGDPDEQD